VLGPPYLWRFSARADFARKAFPSPHCITNRTSTSVATLTLQSGLSEIPRLHLDAVDVQVRHVDVPWLWSLRRQAARVNAGTAVVEFVAATMWQREAVIPITDAGELGGQIC
jgi:hypothetical protein